MEVIVDQYCGTTFYVIDWYGFSPAMDALVVQHGYKGAIDWWNKEPSKWLRACKGRWYWRGYGLGEDDPWPNANGYAFEHKSEALLFKLIWHVDQHNPKMPLICSGKRSDP